MFLIQFSHLLLIHEKDADVIQEDTGHPHWHQHVPDDGDDHHHKKDDHNDQIVIMIALT